MHEIILWEKEGLVSTNPHCAEAPLPLRFLRVSPAVYINSLLCGGSYDLGHKTCASLHPFQTDLIIEFMEIQLLLVLIIAFIVLGPERMIDLAVRMGDAFRRVREVWDEVRMQAYMESVNRKVMEEEEEEEDYNDDLDEPAKEPEPREEELRNGRGKRSAPDNAPDRAPEGAENKAD